MPSAKRKVVLTDKALLALKPAAEGKRYAVWDAAASNLCIKVTDRGVKSFVVIAPMMGKKGKRFAHSILLGHYPKLSLKDARAKVPPTLAMMAEGMPDSIMTDHQSMSREASYHRAT
jgi:hypothetical protein